VIVVSNTSPIINLAAVGKLELLEALFGAILIPEAVAEEIVVKGAGQAGADAVSRAEWITTRSVINRLAVQSLRLELDPGEAESIILAQEQGADLLLLDERRARRVARQFGLPTIGLLGLLIEAKNRGLVENVKDVLDALQTIAGFWISTGLYDAVLLEAGELNQRD
jgi:uncharacterized protein